MKSRFFPTLAVSMMLSAFAAPALPNVSASSMDQAFATISNQEWTWRQHQFAVNEDSPGENIFPHLPDVSETAQNARLAYWENILSKLKQIDPAKLSKQHETDYAVYMYQITTLIADQKFKTYQRPLAGDTSFWSDLADVARSDFHTDEDYRNYISQLNDFPVYFGQNIDNMRAGLKRGFTVPKVVLKGRDSGVRSVLAAKSVEENIYYTPFKKMPATIPAAEQEKLKAAAKLAIQNAVIPAHQKLLKFLDDEYIPHAVPSIAAWDLPDGKAFYDSQIYEYTTTHMSPAEIHALGLSEVAKLHTEMDAVIKEVHFKGSYADFLHFLRTDPQFYAKTPQELLDKSAWVAKEVDGKLSQYFGRLPRQRFAIIPVPADVAPFYTSGRGGPGVYLVNTYDLPSRPLYAMPTLTLHESAPGHAFQMPLAAENKDLPPFRQDSFISAYGEGWALYCERLGDEMGIYHTPYQRFGMLNYQMWRAARLVVDTGMHTMGWSREKAQKYLHDNTSLSDHEIETEVDRYIAWPAQALSYYIGEMDFWRNRHRAEKALGSKFNIRAFHDAVLETGSVPLPELDARVTRFIKDGGKGPYPDEEK